MTDKKGHEDNLRENETSIAWGRGRKFWPWGQRPRWPQGLNVRDILSTLTRGSYLSVNNVHCA